MKCPKCLYNQRVGREGMACKQCGYRFLFNPKSDKYSFTDGRLLHLVDKASYNNTRFFGMRQLYHQYLRHHHKKHSKAHIGCFVVLSFFLIPVLVAGQYVAAGIAGLVLVLLFFFSPVQKWVRSKPMPLDVFEKDYVRKWENRREPFSKLVRKMALQTLPDDAPFDDVYNYGVEYLLIVQRGIMVDLLVLNGWHAENKALVISEKGYPEYVTERARQLLAAQPNLPVLLFHDGTESGEGMKLRLLESRMLPMKPSQIRDLGMSREDVASMPGLKVWREYSHDDGVPVDALMYGTVAVGVAAAFAGGMVMADLLMQRQMEGMHHASGLGSGMDFG